jgi:hypothetical protein
MGSPHGTPTVKGVQMAFLRGLEDHLELGLRANCTYGSTTDLSPPWPATSGPRRARAGSSGGEDGGPLGAYTRASCSAAGSLQVDSLGT